jgi:type I restriction enzyme S subunit
MQKQKIKGPGVVTGRYGTIGEVFYISQDFWPLNTTLFVSEFNGNYPFFISYFLQTIKLSSFNEKTSVPGINRNHLHALTIGLPTVQEQQTIAKGLMSCDSRIAALEHEARLLEELFRAMLEELMSGRLPVGALVKDAA